MQTACQNVCQVEQLNDASRFFGLPWIGRVASDGSDFSKATRAIFPPGDRLTRLAGARPGDQIPCCVYLAWRLGVFHPAGVAAVSRRLSVSDTPGCKHHVNARPRQGSQRQSPVLRPFQGRSKVCENSVSGGIAALNHRLMAGTSARSTGAASATSKLALRAIGLWPSRSRRSEQLQPRRRQNIRILPLGRRADLFRQLAHFGLKIRGELE